MKRDAHVLPLLSFSLPCRRKEPTDSSSVAQKVVKIPSVQLLLPLLCRQLLLLFMLVHLLLPRPRASVWSGASDDVRIIQPFLYQVQLPPALFCFLFHWPRSPPLPFQLFLPLEPA